MSLHDCVYDRPIDFGRDLRYFYLTVFVRIVRVINLSLINALCYIHFFARHVFYCDVSGRLSLQCFNAVGWAAGRASGL